MLVFVAGNPFYDRNLGYSMLRIGRTIAIQGIDHLWVVMVQKDAIFIDLFTICSFTDRYIAGSRTVFPLRCNASV